MARSNKGSSDLIDAVTPHVLSKMVHKSIQKKIPLMIWGQPGIGKSDIVAQVARELGRPLIDIRLPLLDSCDIRGIPFLADVKVYDKEGNLVRDEQGVPVTDKRFSWSPPSDLPLDENSNALVFYDEISAAAPSIQAATYQIILNRQIGNYKLPKQVAIVAAGNRVKDRGVAFNMPSALKNRFMHATLQVSVDDWCQWASLNRVHRTILGYLSFSGADLNTFETCGDSEAFATPRSWYMLSNIMQEIDENGDFVDTHHDEEVLAHMVKGLIGTGVGTKFLAYRKNADKLPQAKKILDGTIKELKYPNIDVVYTLTTGLVYELVSSYEKAQSPNAPKNAMELFHKQYDTFLRFMMDNFPEEMTVMGAKYVMGSPHKLTINVKQLTEWKEFTRRFTDLMPN